MICGRNVWHGAPQQRSCALPTIDLTLYTVKKHQIFFSVVVFNVKNWKKMHLYLYVQKLTKPGRVTLQNLSTLLGQDKICDLRLDKSNCLFPVAQGPESQVSLLVCQENLFYKILKSPWKKKNTVAIYPANFCSKLQQPGSGDLLNCCSKGVSDWRNLPESN